MYRVAELTPIGRHPNPFYIPLRAPEECPHDLRHLGCYLGPSGQRLFFCFACSFGWKMTRSADDAWTWALAVAKCLARSER